MQGWGLRTRVINVVRPTLDSTVLETGAKGDLDYKESTVAGRSKGKLLISNQKTSPDGCTSPERSQPQKRFEHCPESSVGPTGESLPSITPDCRDWERWMMLKKLGEVVDANVATEGKQHTKK